MDVASGGGVRNWKGAGWSRLLSAMLEGVG
jgi:hypothetical protein